VNEEGDLPGAAGGAAGAAAGAGAGGFVRRLSAHMGEGGGGNDVQLVDHHSFPHPQLHKTKSKGYLGIHRKDRITHAFEAEDQSWAVCVCVGGGVRGCVVA